MPAKEHEWTWNVTQLQREASIEILAEFRDRVHRLFFAFGELGLGRDLAREELQKSFKPEQRESTYTLSYPVNDDPNHIELRPIAHMQKGELLEALSRGGEFENENCNALIVFMYHLWDEHYRPRIAEVMGLEKPAQLKSDLFGDIRRIRNAIIHNRAVLSKKEYNKLRVIQSYEEIRPGKLELTVTTTQVIVAGLTSHTLGATPPGEETSKLADVLQERTLHDVVVGAYETLYFNHGKQVWSNPGNERRTDWYGHYIDVIMRPDPRENFAWVIEVETDETFNESHTLSKWKDYNDTYDLWHLAVPMNLVEVAQAQVLKHKLNNCRILVWEITPDGGARLGAPGLSTPVENK